MATNSCHFLQYEKECVLLIMCSIYSLMKKPVTHNQSFTLSVSLLSDNIFELHTVFGSV